MSGKNEQHTKKGAALYSTSTKIRDRSNTYGFFGLAVFAGIMVTFLISVHISFAQTTQPQAQKDSDLDGISDKAEQTIYKTNPEKADSDGDGVLDYQEILDKTNPNDPNSSALTTLKRTRPSFSFDSKNTPIFWYLSRIFGISAFILFTLVVSMGLIMTSKLVLKISFLKAPDALAIHSFNATVLAFSCMVLHIISLMFDSFIRLKPLEIFVPFTVTRALRSGLGFDFRLPISIGVFAMYFSIVLLFTSHTRGRLLSTKLWRKLHYGSFLFYILFVIHGILSGTDSTQWWMRLLYVWSIIQVSSLLLLRIFGKKYFLPRPVSIPQPQTQFVRENVPS